MPQSVSEIRVALSAAGLRPQKQFGQNFLIDLNLMRKLPAAADVRAGDVVLEVGPGTGSLTELLLEAGAHVIAVEIDRGLAALLTQHFVAAPRFTLLNADALARKNALNPTLVEQLTRQSPAVGASRKLVANLPYQIATPLLIELLSLTQSESHTQPLLSVLVCTIQREVAERLRAAADTNAYGPLSIIAQTVADVEQLAVLPPRAFWPAPKVDSALVRLRPKPLDERGVTHMHAFSRVVKEAFAQRRKMMRRVARGWWGGDVEARLTALDVDPECRPETLSPAVWRRLSAAVDRLPE